MSQRLLRSFSSYSKEERGAVSESAPVLGIDAGLKRCVQVFRQTDLAFGRAAGAICPAEAGSSEPGADFCGTDGLVR